MITTLDTRTKTTTSPVVTRLALRFVIPVVLAIFAAPFVVLLFYSLPALDDFCKATFSFTNGVPQRGILAVTWLYYTQWSPRWLTTFLQSLIMSRVDLVSTYGWLLLLVILTNLASLWYFFLSVFRFNWKKSLLVAAVFYAAWVASITHPTEQLYWLTGSMEYNLSLSTMLVLAGLLCHPKKGAWYYLLLCTLSIAVPAQHEIAGVLTCALLLGGIIIMRAKRLFARQWYVSFGGVLLSLVAVMLSPGNSARAAQQHRHLWDVVHAPHWIAHSFYHGINWLSFPAVLLAVCCIFLLSESEEKTQTAFAHRQGWLGPACLGVMFLIICESAFVEIATGTWITVNVEAWFQFVFWLAFVCFMLTGVPELHRVQFSAGTRIGVYVLFGVTILGSTNFRWAASDVRGPAQDWWRVDSAQLRSRGGSLEFETPAQYPHLTMPQFITRDPKCWVNECLANYLQASAVVAKNSLEECPH